jgi:N-methylhydantoinase A/oxoprolinase/acetone carboxylase beta subunit
LHLHKVLSTPSNPAEAVVQGVSELLAQFGDAVELDGLQVLGATTVVTNAVLERRGVKTGFITTAGFQDMLRIRNEGRYDLYDLNLKYPDPLVTRANSFGAVERVAADGEVMTALKEDTVREIAGRLRDQGISSVAVCLLHAYKYPAHEQRIAALLREENPDIFVSLSSDVCPEVREFDRASTTVINAYTRPQMSGHVGHLQREFAAEGIDRQVLWMTSSGGLVPSRRAAELPVRLIESGPAAGAVAAAEFGRIAGEGSVLSFDMGGTTAKLCLIPNGEPTVGTDLEVAHYHRFRKGSGFPLKIQSIRMIEIGAGGGSIAAKNPLGLLDVGPRSAGAVPGPAAYQRGGAEPTVTDADILLGYMGTESFVGSILQGLEGCCAGGDDKARSLPRRQCAALRLWHSRSRQRVHEQGCGSARDRPRRRSPQPADGRLRRRGSGARLWHRSQARHQAGHLSDRRWGHLRDRAAHCTGRGRSLSKLPDAGRELGFRRDGPFARRSRCSGRGGCQRRRCCARNDHEHLHHRHASRRPGA